MFKKILNKIKNRRLLVVLVLLFFAVNIFAIFNTFTEKTTSSIWDGSVAKKFKKGTGAANDPYVIDTGSELAYFFTVINAEDNTEYFNKFYVLNNNINMNGRDFSFSEFGKTFSGHFDGNGYKIFNFTINDFNLDEEKGIANFNLFDSLYSADIKNINFSDITFNIDKKIIGSEQEITVEETLSNGKYSIMLVNEDGEGSSEVTSEEPKEEPKKSENTKSNDTVVDTKEEQKEESTKTDEVPTETPSETPSETPGEDVTDTQKDDTTEEPTEEPKEDNTGEVTDTPEDGEGEGTTVEENEEPTGDDVVETIKVNGITVSLFKDVENSNISNISANNIQVKYNGKEKYITSSLFVLNDVDNNTISNINISGKSNTNGTSILVNNYSNARLNNIIYQVDGLNFSDNYKISSNDSIYRYQVKDGKLTFYDDYTVKSMLSLMNGSSTLRWKLVNNEFVIENNGVGAQRAIKSLRGVRAAPSGHASGTDGTTVYVNDYDADRAYYQGLNYTYSSNGNIPTMENKEIYTDSNLVYVQINYHGTDVEGNYTGTLSPTENYNMFTYYKVCPVQSGKIKIELIDNPFSNAPLNRTFNGWVSNYAGAEVTLDTDIYVRYLTVPVTMTGGVPDNMTIDVYAVWNLGKIVTYATNWSTTFGNLHASGFHEISSVTSEREPVAPLWVRRTTTNGNRAFPAGSVDENGNALSGSCPYGQTCPYYVHPTDGYNSTVTYYKLINGTMTQYAPQLITHYTTEVPVGESIAGYYRKIKVPNGGSFAGYYNSSGVLQTGGTCNTNGGCDNYYELIQFYDDQNNPEQVVTDTIYYYFTTRDTNVVILAGTVQNAWASGQNKPFTLTARRGNTNNYSSALFRTSGFVVHCYADTRIENIRIFSNVQFQTGDAQPSTGNGTIFADTFNLKIGRGVTSSNTSRAVAPTVIGSKNSATGSSGSPTTYRFIVESGTYNNIGVANVTGGGNTSNYYIHAQGIFGSDYARVTETDPETTSELDVRYNLGGSWSGYIRGSSSTDIAIFTNIKSGRYGTNKYDCYAGVYVGGQINGSLYAGRVALVEGGYIYNLIGGPLSNSSMKNINDTFIYVKGGFIDLIFGGAGVAATYGNKIVQVTGGLINYSICGGSNGVNGTNNQRATLDSSTYVYVGGNATVGKQSLVTANTSESESAIEAGSVFGGGNGKSGNDTIGTVNNSYVVIDGSATINRNVYGGGNYGATGQNGSNHTYETKIAVHGAEVKGSVYGGGNNNGAGSTSNTLNITIDMDGGTVDGSVYGGSRTRGYVYGSTTVNIKGGSIYTDVYGGGEGGWQSNTNYGTFVRDDVAVTIGDATAGPTINGNVYGGSAYGTVNATTRNATHNNHTVDVTVNNGTILGSVFGGAKGSSTYTPYISGDITVDINGGTINNVYGSFDAAGKPKGTVEVTIDGGSVVNAFGGGNQTSIDDTDIKVRGGSVTVLYGGSNQTGDVDTTTVAISGGSVGTVYGGNNAGGSCTTTSVSVTGGTINAAIYGGGNVVNTTTTNVSVTNQTANTTIPYIYGGGNQAGATTTNVTLNGANVKATNVYGGSNQSGNVTNSYVTIGNGEYTNVYGGNNAGGQTATTHVTINSGKITTLYGGGNSATSGVTNVVINNTTTPINETYGGGNAAACTTTNVTVNQTGGTFGTIYGGGNSAGATTTNVTLTSANAKASTIYGGSNTTGNVTNSYVTIENGEVGTIYGSNNAGGQTATTHISVENGKITTIYGGGNQASSGTTNVTVTGASSTITDIYGGGNSAGATTTNVTIGTTTNQIGVTNIYGGSNTTGNVTTSNVNVVNATGTNIFGSNNAGGSTATTNVTVDTGAYTNVYGGGNYATATDTNVIINDGTFTNVYGGGNQAAVGNDTNVTINDGTFTNLYGGGNQAAVGNDTNVIVNTGAFTNLYGGGNAAGVGNNTSVDILNATIAQNVYGGGNLGTVGGDTDVLIHNTSVNGSAYAGGNGAAAIVSGNTTIVVSGTSTIGTSSCTLLSTCSVFGGGNAAATGTTAANDSVATVKIKGATVYGNVYGGANTSKVFGETIVDIGADVPAATNVVAGDVHIYGTVFGGGEANASGSSTYDFSFISVTRGVTMNINGQGYNNFEVDGSFFGSGNASSSEGDSEITIKNYGTFNNPERNISIQRANLVTIDNSNIVLQGATDRTNEFSDVLFSISRVDELDIKNNTTLFLENGANLLKEFKSLNANGSYATVTIDDDGVITSRSTNNRLYLYAGKHLDIAKDQNATDMGDVYGMTFFGMYKYNTNNDTVNVGTYGEQVTGDNVDWSKAFDNVTSYVAGYHKTNHNIEADGFYTNFADEETSKFTVAYIEPTPPTGPLYMWIIGAGVIEYEVDLNASRYSTLGTTELSLRDFTDPNTTFNILGFDYSELELGVSLIDKTQVKKIADTSSEADNVMGISMETSNTGWLNNAQTSFVSDPDDPVVGTTSYVGGSQSGAPTVLLYLHHSKNIATAGSMGKVKIQLMSVRQINALDKETKRLIITINLSRTLYDTISYEGSMTAGRKYEMFTSTATNITSSSAISAYYALFATDENIYKTGYHRTLVSTFVFPLNTKITMIDLSGDTPEYFYKVITQADVTRAQNEMNNIGEASYNTSMFEAMGAENSGVYYDDATKNGIYYSPSPEYCEEEFIFIIDFGDTTISTDQLNNKLLLEMRNSSDATIYSVLAPQHDNLTYNIYANKDALIDISGTISSNKIYVGESFTADIHIDYTQSTLGSTVIYDTHYFDSKLGIKISLINSQGNVVTGTTLLGLHYDIDEVRYDPNIDGTTRIKVADKVDSAEKWIIIDTGTSAIATGNYKLRIETFGSTDGIYYGLNSSDYIDFDIEIVNEIYGLDVDVAPEEMIINSVTGKNENDENSLTYNITYNSGLTNPNIRVKMYRRGYSSIDDTSYHLVDLADYFTDTLTSTGTNEYMVDDDPDGEIEFSLTNGTNLMSGTYKLQFILYDDTAVIGSVDKYIIIK